MQDEDFKLLRGFDRQTDEGTDICDCRVAFATENKIKSVDFFHTFKSEDLRLTISPLVWKK